MCVTFLHNLLLPSASETSLQDMTSHSYLQPRRLTVKMDNLHIISSEAQFCICSCFCAHNQKQISDCLFKHQKHKEQRQFEKTVSSNKQYKYARFLTASNSGLVLFVTGNTSAQYHFKVNVCVSDLNFQLKKTGIFVVMSGNGTPESQKTGKYLAY